jgi:hypothetical protein
MKNVMEQILTDPSVREAGEVERQVVKDADVVLAWGAE